MDARMMETHRLVTLIAKAQKGQQLTKSELMKLITADIVHEAFTHEHEGVFDVTAMRDFAKANLFRQSIAMNDSVIQELRKYHIIDEARISELQRASWLDDPALIVQYMEEIDGVLQPTMLLVDGVHRIIRRFHEGLDFFEAYIFEESQIIRPKADWINAPDVWGESIESFKNKQ